MPGIAGPDLVSLKALYKLAGDGLDPVTFPSQLMRPRLSFMLGGAEWRQQS
jgi:hypothetical protein